MLQRRVRTSGASNGAEREVSLAQVQFPEVAMTLAAVDRLVHHSTIFELNVESYRRRTATPVQARTAPEPKAKKD